MILDDSHEQHYWIETLAYAYSKNMKVVKRKDGVPIIQKPFCEVTKHWFPIDDREVLPNEIVFDFDGDNKIKNNLYTKKIKSYLEREDIPFYEYKYGGRSSHIHLFFKIPDNNIDYFILKKRIFNYLLNNSKLNRIKSCVDLGINTTRRHLVRAMRGNQIPTELIFWELDKDGRFFRYN